MAGNHCLRPLGTDNIKTYGESLAQVMWMVGVRPVPDALGQ